MIRQVFKNTVCWRHLEQVTECEKRAIEMVVKSGLLKGLTKEDIKSAASTVILRDGCRRFFQKLAENESPNISVHIISYCWCSELIKEVLSPGIKACNIHSNELAYENGLTTGDITRIVETPSNELKTFCATELKSRT